MSKRIIVAVDGHSACGKSTMAKELARRHHFIFIDTGAMYRAVTLYALRQGFFAPDDTLDTARLVDSLDQISVSFEAGEDGQFLICLNGEIVEQEIRGLAVSDRVSPVATVPEVREKMVRLQREIASRHSVVLDGRDIGTVVFPQAELKFFVTASADVRAQRRYNELKAKGMEADYEAILHNIVTRDRIDSERAVSPLRKADDAIEIDSSHMTVDEQNDFADRILINRINELGRD